MSRYVLDACALIALLQDETGADKVAAVFNAASKGEAEIVMHKINLLEVYYGVYRSRGKPHIKSHLLILSLWHRPSLLMANS